MDDDELFPSHPFTTVQARHLGIERRRLDEAVAQGRVLRPMRGAYRLASVAATPLVRAQTVRLVTSATSVVCDRTAAWLWEVDCLRFAELDGTPPVESCVLRGHQATERQQVDGVTRDLLPEDWVELGGVRVTTPLRTAADLGCRLWAPRALGVMDALMRAHGFTQGDLQRLLSRYRRRRGVVQLRSLVAMVDARAESQPESWVRWFIVSEGHPCPEPQVWVLVEGQWYRLDLSYPHARILVEYDGEEFHLRTAEQREHDERRREALRRVGWVVIVVTREGLTVEGQSAWLSELRDALRSRRVHV
jgi:hypothetical protein